MRCIPVVLIVIAAILGVAGYAWNAWSIYTRDPANSGGGPNIGAGVLVVIAAALGLIGLLALAMQFVLNAVWKR